MNLYNQFDDAIMYGVNKGVKAWNWSTGKTKADLANKLLTVAPIVEGSCLINEDPFLGSAFTGLLLFISHKYQERNIKQEKTEQRVAESDVMLCSDNKYERTNKEVGLGCLIASGMFSYMGHSDNDFVFSGLGIGSGIRGISQYIMRADYFPPRKSAFRKAKEKLGSVKENIVDRIKGIDWLPSPEPKIAPVPIRRPHSTMENYLLGVNIK